VKYAKILAFILILSTTLVYAKDKQKSDWNTYYGAGIAPAYPHTATLKSIVSNDAHSSFTDSNGRTTSVHCDDDGNCYEGTGVYHYLVLEDGRQLFVELVPHDELLSGHVAKLPTRNVLLENVDREITFHVRLLESGFADGRIEYWACIQVPGTESIPDGKQKRQLARQQALETCYDISRADLMRNGDAK
jgi:hypothetical protein